MRRTARRASAKPVSSAPNSQLAMYPARDVAPLTTHPSCSIRGGASVLPSPAAFTSLTSLPLPDPSKICTVYSNVSHADASKS